MRNPRHLIAPLVLGVLWAAPAFAQGGGVNPNGGAPNVGAPNVGATATEAPKTGTPGAGTPLPAANSGANGRVVTSGNYQQQQTAKIQQELQAQGLYTGEVDGLMGPETRKALSDFQSANGLRPTGTLDVATLAKLNQAQAANNANQTPARPGTANQALNPQQQRAQEYRARRGTLTRPGAGTNAGGSVTAAAPTGGPNYANPTASDFGAGMGSATTPSGPSGPPGYFGYSSDMSNGFNAATGRR